MLALAGCGQPLVAVQPGAVQLSPEVRAEILTQAKAAFFSPEVTSMISNHVQGTMQATVAVEVHKQVQRATSQPISHRDSGDTGGNKTNVLATLSGGDWAVVILIVAYNLIKAARDAVRIIYGAQRGLARRRARNGGQP
jgi:hypothetical protein